MLRPRQWLARHAGLVVVTLLAFAVRVVWNLSVHPLLDYRRSDMGAYLGRANAMIEKPWTPDPHLTIFPYGTHFLVYGVKRLFGADNGVALGLFFAAMGALAVGYCFALARRLSPLSRVRWLAGVLLIFYYPWISFSGYVLSETPFALALSATAFYSLRLADRGRAGDAWLLGVTLALGAAVRPQILLSAALLGLCFLFRRRVWRGGSRWHPARIAVPLVVILAASSVRLYWHTSTSWHNGQMGLVSTNGPLNYALGRCHAIAIASDGNGYFSSPSLGALAGYDKSPQQRPLLPLDPVLGTTARFSGQIWEPLPAYALAHRCVEKTGYLVQARFALTHVVLLWAYNLPWPDQAQIPPFRRAMRISQELHCWLVLPLAAASVLLSFRRRRARRLLLAIHPLAMVLTAMIYFGDARFRVPYDGILVVLAADLLISGIAQLRRRSPLLPLAKDRSRHHEI